MRFRDEKGMVVEGVLGMPVFLTLLLTGLELMRLAFVLVLGHWMLHDAARFGSIMRLAGSGLTRDQEIVQRIRSNSWVPVTDVTVCRATLGSGCSSGMIDGGGPDELVEYRAKVNFVFAGGIRLTPTIVAVRKNEPQYTTATSIGVLQ